MTSHDELRRALSDGDDAPFADPLIGVHEAVDGVTICELLISLPEEKKFNPKIATALLKAPGLDANAPLESSPCGDTLFLRACRAGHAKLVALLLDLTNADPMVKNAKGQDARAVTETSADVLELLDVWTIEESAARVTYTDSSSSRTMDSTQLAARVKKKSRGGMLASMARRLSRSRSPKTSGASLASWDEALDDEEALKRSLDGRFDLHIVDAVVSRGDGKPLGMMLEMRNSDTFDASSKRRSGFLAWCVVAKVKKRSPAWKAGIRAEDRIVEVNGTGTNGLWLPTIKSLLSKSDDETLRITFTRRVPLFFKGDELDWLRLSNDKTKNLLVALCSFLHTHTSNVQSLSFVDEYLLVLALEALERSAEDVDASTLDEVKTLLGTDVVDTLTFDEHVDKVSRHFRQHLERHLLARKQSKQNLVVADEAQE